MGRGQQVSVEGICRPAASGCEHPGRGRTVGRFFTLWSIVLNTPTCTHCQHPHSGGLYRLSEPLHGRRGSFGIAMGPRHWVLDMAASTIDTHSGLHLRFIHSLRTSQTPAKI